MTDDDKKALRHAVDLIEQARTLVEDCAGNLRTEFDEMTERQQESPRGEAVSEGADGLDTATDALDTAEGEIRAQLEK